MEIQCTYCSSTIHADALREHMSTVHADKMRALGERLARYGRRRRAAEQGQDWTKVN